MEQVISLNEVVKVLGSAFGLRGVELEKIKAFYPAMMHTKSKYGRNINYNAFDSVVNSNYLYCDENEMEGFVDHIVGFYIYAYKASVEYCTDVYLLLSSAANYFEYIDNATKAKKAKEMASKFLDDVHYYRACDEDFIKEFNKLVYM